MTSRERTLNVISHKEVDQLPYNLRLVPELMEMIQEKIGTIDYAEYFHHDIRYVSLKLPEKPDELDKAQWVPSPSEEAIAEIARETQEMHSRGLAVCGTYFMGVYEQAKDWLGDEETMIAPYESPSKFSDMLERITTWKCALYGAYVTAGVDIVWIGDDLGTQRSLVMSPEMYRKWYRPHHINIVNNLRAIRPDIRIAFHCCGHVTPLIRDLIEIGIDVLEAVQPECMDIAILKREYGKDITFWGGVGAQSVLSLKTQKEVIDRVQETLEIMSFGSGYIAAPCHTLTEEVSWENIIAFHEGVRCFNQLYKQGREDA